MKRIQVSVLFVAIVVILAALMLSCAAATQGDSKAAGGESVSKAVTHPMVDFSRGCVECHTTVTPEITDQWSSSGHGRLNFGCYICHGDGEEYFVVNPGNDGCVSCHSASMEHLDSVGETSCFECHNGHTLIAE